MKRFSLQRFLGTLILVAGFTAPATWALAGTSGGIAGVVKDAKTGTPLVGVRLHISAGSQDVSTTTDAHGHFVVFYLQPDDYTLTAEKDGYEARSISGYSVYADQTQQYDLQLTPASGTTQSNR